MIQIIHWLESHKWVNALLVLFYALFVVFAHDFFVQISVDVMNSLSLDVYNQVVAAIALALLLGLVYLVSYGIKNRSKVDFTGLVFLMMTIAGLVVHFFVFTEMNIEFIHAAEFGILAVLLYPLVGRFGAAISFALPVMVIDEWYQYQVLYPETVEYFDFNDLQLDLLGAGLFLSMLKTFRILTKNQPVEIFRRVEFYAILHRALAVIILLSFSVIVPYADQATDSTWLVLNAIQEPYGFWRVHPTIGSTYHVLEPIAGLFTVFGICLTYMAMDPISSEK